jgi:GYF domain 2
MATTTVLLLACLIAWLASTKGRNPVGWFLLGAFFNVFALVLVLLLPDLQQEGQQVRRTKQGHERLREEFKNHRQRTELELAEAHVRLDAHDRLAQVNTRIAPLQQAEVGQRTLSAGPTPPLPAAAQPRWYYEYQGLAQGPESDSALKLRFLRGELLPATLVWRDGLADWVRAETQSELFA